MINFRIIFYFVLTNCTKRIKYKLYIVSFLDDYFLYSFYTKESRMKYIRHIDIIENKIIFIYKIIYLIYDSIRTTVLNFVNSYKHSNK